MIAKMLALPLPIYAAAIIPQVAPEAVDGGPGWVAVFLLGAYVTIWYLNQIGRLPGGAGVNDRRKSGFQDDDRESLQKLKREVGEIHAMLGHRGEDGIERFLTFVRKVSDTNNRLARLEEDGQRLTSANIATLQAIQTSLAQIHSKLDKLSDRRA